MLRRNHGIRNPITRWLAGLCAAAGLLTAPAAHADGVLLGGANWYDEGVYYSLGSLFPLNGDFGKDGPILKVWVYGTDFDYDAGFDDVNAEGFGGEVSIGYQKLFEHGRVAGYVGVTHRDLDLSPDDPDADGLEKDTGIPIQFEGGYEFTDMFGVDGIASYTAIYNEYWGRFRPFTRLGPLYVGPELILNGGDEFDNQYYGVFVGGIPLGFEGAGLELSGGLMHREGGHNSGYGGVSFSYGF